MSIFRNIFSCYCFKDQKENEEKTSTFKIKNKYNLLNSELKELKTEIRIQQTVNNNSIERLNEKIEDLKKDLQQNINRTTNMETKMAMKIDMIDNKIDNIMFLLNKVNNNNREIY